MEDFGRPLESRKGSRNVGKAEIGSPIFDSLAVEWKETHDFPLIDQFSDLKHGGIMWGLVGQYVSKYPPPKKTGKPVTIVDLGVVYQIPFNPRKQMREVAERAKVRVMNLWGDKMNALDFNDPKTFDPAYPSYKRTFDYYCFRMTQELVRLSKTDPMGPDDKYPILTHKTLEEFEEACTYHGD